MKDTNTMNLVWDVSRKYNDNLRLYLFEIYGNMSFFQHFSLSLFSSLCLINVSFSAFSASHCFVGAKILNKEQLVKHSYKQTTTANNKKSNLAVEEIREI